MNFKNTLPRLALGALLAISMPAWASNSTRDFDHRRPGGPGWGHRGCYNQRDIEFAARRLTEQADRFRFSAERAPGFERLALGVQRFIDTTRDFSLRADRARDCEEIRYDFRPVEEHFYRIERHYSEIQQRERWADRYLDQDFRNMEYSFRALRDVVQGLEHQPPGPGGPGHGPGPHPGHPFR